MMHFGQTLWKKLGFSTLLALLLLLVLLPVSSRAEDKSFNDDNWSGTVRNVDISSWEVIPDVDITLKWADLWVVKIPYGIESFRFNLTVKMGVKGEFDVTFKQPNLPAGYEFNHQITAGNMYLNRYNLGDSIFNNIPDIGLIGFRMNMELVGGATGEARVQGNFSSFVEVKAGTDGFSVTQMPDFQFTSIEPRNPNEKTLVFLGANTQQNYHALKIGVWKISIGPVLKVALNFMTAGQAEATLHKDEWHSDSNLSYLEGTLADPEPESVHSCTEEGRKGCVSGRTSVVQDQGGTISASATAFEFEFYKFNWPVAADYRQRMVRDFVQSLTWNEKLKYASVCDHMYYKVPVQVWGDDAKTVPIPGVRLKLADLIDYDSNMKRFVTGVTGANPILVALYNDPSRQWNGNGRANLYLPYTDGRYTIQTDTYDTPYQGMNGAETQPSDMKRRDNDVVHIVLGSQKKVSMAVKKEWDIDFEDKDRPQEIEVLLQKNSWNSNMITKYFCWTGVEKVTLSAANNWEHIFTDLPRYEVDPDGNLREIRYRVRELKPGKSGDAAADAELDLEGNHIQEAQGLIGIDNGAMAEDSKRVVNDWFDADNTNVVGAFKSLKSIEQVWKFSPNVDYLKSFAKKLGYRRPMVSYTVDDYTTITGKDVPKHKTKYAVNYDISEDIIIGADGNSEKRITTKITDTAVLSMGLWKRWLMFGDAEKPKSVLLALCYRIDPEYIDQVPDPSGVLHKFGGAWIPVINPVDGSKINILKLLGLDIAASLDIYNKVSIPVAVAQVKGAKEGANPLSGWNAGFIVKKYGFLGVPGVPVEFQAAELSSVLIQDIVKIVTGFDLPISTSIIDAIKGNPYVSIPGKMYKIPWLDDDTERTGNVINFWNTTEDDTAIGGSKYWVNDTEANRPEELTIKVKGTCVAATDEDKKTKEFTIKLKKADNAGYDSWIWGLSTADEEVLDWLEANGLSKKSANLADTSQFTWKITEECPAGYTSHVDSFDIFNTWGDSPRVEILKKFADRIPAGKAQNTDFSLTITDTDSHTSSVQLTGAAARGESGDQSYEFTEGTLSIKGKDVSRFKVVETALKDPSTFDWIPEVTGPVVSVRDGNPVYTFTVTNRYRNGTAKIVLQKEWKGDREADRPNSVNVTVKQNGTEINKVRLLKSGSWQETITTDSAGNPLKAYDASGKPYKYTVEEESLKGYQATSSVSSSKTGDTETAYTFKLINEYTNSDGFVALEGRKTWDDDDNASGSRPDKLIISVMQSGGAAAAQQEVTAAGGWAWKFTGLPRYDADGKPITYQVMEGTANADGSGTLQKLPGYSSVSYTDPTFDEASLTWKNADITNSTKTINIAVRKIWEDDNDRNGMRPDSVTVHLRRSTEGGSPQEIAEAVLDEDSGWDYTFKGLAKANSAGKAYTYTVDEDAVEHYTPSTKAEKDDEGNIVGYTLTNTLDNNYITIPVRKVWENDEDVKSWARPASVTIRLMKTENGRKVPVMITGEDGTEGDAILVLTAGENWEDEFTGIPEKDNTGAKIDYTVEEDPVSGYSDEKVEKEYDGFRVTNTYNNKMFIRVTKAWSELTTDASGQHPDSITFEVTGTGADGTGTYTGTLRESDDWTTSFEADQCDSRNQEITYTIRETTDLTDEYRVSCHGWETEAGIDFVILNAREKRNLKIIKIWDDEGDLLKNRPADGIVEVDVYADGTLLTGTGFPVRLETKAGQNEASASVMLPAYDAKTGNYIVYTVQERNVPAGYTAKITGSMSVGYTITNSLEKMDISVRKVWKDDGNAAKQRPDSVTVRLNAVSGGRKQTVDTVTLDGKTGWVYTFRGKVTYMDGKPCTYEVTEDSVSEYAATISGSAADGFEIVNEFGKTELEITKVWGTGYKGKTSTEDSRDIPGSVTLEVLQKLKSEGDDAYTVFDKVTLTKEDQLNDTDGNPILTVHQHYQWQTKISVPERDPKGESYEYTVREPKLGDDVTSTVQRDSGGRINVVNETGSRRKSTHTYIVNVVWDDMNDQFGLRPDYITATLIFKDQSVQDYLAIDRNENWRAVYETERTVTAVAADTVASYTSRVVQDSERVFTIYYQMTPPPTTNIIVNKVWDDAGDANGVRPDGVTVGLYRQAAGEASPRMIQSHTLTEKENWTYTFANLPSREISKTGDQYIYTVQELTHADGYTTTIRKSRESTSQQGNTWCTYTITNTYPMVDIRVTKEWDDDGVSAVTRPEYVEIFLLADGEEVDSVALTPGYWTYTFANMPTQGPDGGEIQYTIEEGPVTGYEEPVITGSAQEGFTVTNKVKTMDIQVTKVWVHNGNTTPPGEVTLILKADGQEKGRFTATADNLTHTFADMPAYRSGEEEIHYSVVEEKVPAGYKATYGGSAETGFTVTNTFVVTDISVTKEWYDEGYETNRPDQITVTLKSDKDSADTMAVVATATVSAADNWQYWFENMPVYAEDGRIICYSMDEAKVANYGEMMIQLSDYEFELHNWYMDPDETVVLVSKGWQRDDKAIRPASVTVELHRRKAPGDAADDDQFTVQTKTIYADPPAGEEASAPWLIAFGGLERYWEDADHTKHLYDYYIREIAVPGYSTEMIKSADDDGDVYFFQIINTAQSAPVTFEGTKTLAGKELQDGEFTFALYEEGREIDRVQNDAEGKFAFQTIRYQAADRGIHTYTVKEVSEGGGGIAIDTTVYTVTVEVTVDTDGTVTAKPSENAGKLDFINTYQAAGTVTFQGTKTMEGRTMTAEDIYSFEITEPGTANRWEVQNSADGRIAYPEIRYVLDGKTDDRGIHNYEIRELETGRENVLKDENVYRVQIDVQDDGKGNLTAVPAEAAGYTNPEELNFVNHYAEAVSVTFRGTKELVGREMTKDDIYSFEITEIGTDHQWTVQNDADGRILYPQLIYYKSAARDDTGIHTYRIREASDDGAGVFADDTLYTVTVEIIAEEDGTLRAETSENASELDFINSYGCTTSITFLGTKTVSGRAWSEKDDIYSFEVTEDGTDNRWVVQNEGDGDIPYPTIWYAKNDKQDDTGTHVYKVRELETDTEGITPDPRQYKVTVEVYLDDGMDLVTDVSADAWELDFDNAYGAAGMITFEGTKTVTGREWGAEDVYSFEVREKGESVNHWEVINDENGKIQYPTIRYTLEDVGQHVYEVWETDPDKDGLVTDRTVYTVVVNVADDGKGHLIITSENTKGLDFVNHYGAEASITFEGTKAVTGRDWDDDDIFTFEILEKETMHRWTAENDLNGKIHFPEIDYIKNEDVDDTGTHTYYVREIDKDVEGIRGDKRLYEVTVTVTDAGNGRLEVTASDNAKALNFENQYGITGSFYFSGIKQMEGRELTSEDIFLYEVAETGKDNKWYITNDANGQIIYPRISFVRNEKADETGEHRYTVREVETDTDAVFDETVYDFTVKVSVSEDGKYLNVETPEEIKTANFTNIPVYTITYDPNGGLIDGQAKPVQEKHYYGEEITIRERPVRGGYRFLYWKGSSYDPGDKYTVTEDHTFTAQWQESGGFDYPFTFTKKWTGGHEDSIEWTLYSTDGTEVHKKFNKKTVSDTEWKYEAWFQNDEDYYIIETVPKGYRVRYENTGAHAGVTDRCYNGGTIINSKIPKTGDDSPLWLWIALIVLGFAGVSISLLLVRKKRNK